MDTETIGKEDWEELQRNLEATIPVYDRVNRVATFGQVSRWRRMVRNRLPEEGRILEIGCGPGSFAEDVMGYDLVCLDPIPEMLRVAEERVNSARSEKVILQLHLSMEKQRSYHLRTLHLMRCVPCSHLETGMIKEQEFLRHSGSSSQEVCSSLSIQLR